MSVILRVSPKLTQEFHMPPSPNRLLILTGPGTGLEPFMGFLAHHRAVNDHSSGSGGVTRDGWRNSGYPPLRHGDPVGDVNGGNVERRFRARGRRGEDYKREVRITVVTGGGGEFLAMRRRRGGRFHVYIIISFQFHLYLIFTSFSFHSNFNMMLSFIFHFNLTWR